MKKVTNLKENECIHCRTKEEFKAILELNPDNKVGLYRWKEYREKTVYYPFDLKMRGAFSSYGFAKQNNYTIHPASDFLEPTYQLTKSQIIEIAENGSLVKELFPECFEEEYTEKGWYLATCYETENYLCYFENPKNLISKCWFSPSLRFNGSEGNFSKIQRKANYEEVTEALINEAKRRGFKEGCIYNFSEMKNLEAKGDLLFGWNSPFDLFFQKTSGFVFSNGKWAEIIQTPTEVIKIIETYGKDKLITLIEQYERNSK